MSNPSAPVVWSEGLFLRPHHFQQQDRFVQQLLDSRLRALSPAGYGFVTHEIERSLLLQGKLALARASGVFPDGTPFSVPSSAARVGVLNVPEGTRDATVYLSVALAGQKSVALEEGARRTRFVAVDATVADNIAGFDSEAEVKVGALAITLDLESELQGEYSSLPVARIVERRADGSVLLDERFVPPLLDVAAHPVFSSWLEEIHGLLRQRGETLAMQIAAPGTKGLAEIADFMLLLVCNRYEPLLAHLRNTAPLHPLALLSTLLQLAGECASFGRPDRRPPEFPAYAHMAPVKAFEPVIQEIRRAMTRVIEKNVIQIPLQELGRGLYTAEVPDVGLIRNASFVLLASAQVPKHKLREALPTQVKIGPPETIKDLVVTQVPGIRLEATDPPRQLPLYADFTYFLLDARSEFWKPIEVTRQIAIYVAGEPPGLELQMWAIRSRDS